MATFKVGISQYYISNYNQLVQHHFWLIYFPPELKCLFLYWAFTCIWACFLVFYTTEFLFLPVSCLVFYTYITIRIIFIISQPKFSSFHYSVLYLFHSYKLWSNFAKLKIKSIWVLIRITFKLWVNTGKFMYLLCWIFPI